MSFIKSTAVASVIALATASTSFAKDTLYIVNSGSKGGSYNGQLTALSASLSTKYDIEYVQAKGCKKTSSILKKLSSKGATAISLYSSSSHGFKEDCIFMRPNKDNYMFANSKAGIIFSHKDVKNNFLTNGNTIGISSELDKIIKQIGQKNNISFKTVRYKNAKSVTLGVLNKEVDFGISNNSKRFWKNTDKLNGHFVLFNDSLEGIPSLKKLGVAPGPALDVYIYFGTNREKLISDIKNVYTTSNSDYANWYAGQKGIKNNIMDSDDSRFSDVQAYALP